MHKRDILFLLCLVFCLGSSCKKSLNCDRTIAGISGDYKLIRWQTNGFGDIDLSPGNCDGLRHYNFHSNELADIYFGGSSNSCNVYGSTDCRWGVIGDSVLWLLDTQGMNIDYGRIKSFDCQTLVIEDTISKYTFTLKK